MTSPLKKPKNNKTYYHAGCLLITAKKVREWGKQIWVANI
jgi:hypothetical protein